MRGDAFLPNYGYTQVTSFLLFHATEPDKKKLSSPLSAFSSACVDGPGSEVWGPGVGISPSTSNSVSFSKFSLQKKKTGSLNRSVLSYKGAVSQNLSKFNQ